MPLYPAWLDYLPWGFCIAGGICAFSALSEPTGLRRGRQRLTATALFGVGILVAGVIGIFANVRSPRPTVAGTIAHVERSSASKNRYTHFNVLTDHGESIELTTGSDFKELELNAKVTVTYQPFANRPLDIEVLSGQYEGWHHTESDGMFGSVIATFAGLFVVFAGIFFWRSNPTAQVDESVQERNPNLDGDVDTKSLLNLSARDD